MSRKNWKTCLEIFKTGANQLGIFRRYFKKLVEEFGWRMPVLVFLVYGLNQGFGQEFGWLAGKYFFKDVLLLDVAEAQTINNVIKIPWTIKPLYGMISDTVPIFGYARGPYICLAGIIGMISWIFLGGLNLPIAVVVCLLTMANLSVASPDVMIDAAIAEKSRLHPSFTSDLQSLCWGSHAAGGLVASVLVGVVVRTWDSKIAFCVTSLTAAVLILPATWNWLGEKQLPKVLWKPKWQQLYNQRSIFGLAVFLSLCALCVSLVSCLSKSAWINSACSVFGAVLSAIASYVVLSKYNKWVAKVALYVFLTTSTNISADEAFFYWYTDNKEGPLFTPAFMGYIDFIGYISMAVGVILFNKYFSTWNYRRMFAVAQVLLTLINLTDLVLVTRHNLKLGIPDYFFVMGEEAFSPMFQRFRSMPVFILAVKVCPAGIEGTMFALLMSLSNFGQIISKILGVATVRALGISKENYSEMPSLVLVKSLSRLLPLLLIPVLVPDTTPTHPILRTNAMGNGLNADSDDHHNPPQTEMLLDNHSKFKGEGIQKSSWS